MLKKSKLEEELEDYDSYNPYPDETIKSNEKALTREYDVRRDKKDEKDKDEYTSKVIKSLDTDLVKQKEEYNRKKNVKFSALKKLLRGE